MVDHRHAPYDRHASVALFFSSANECERITIKGGATNDSPVTGPC